MKRSSCYYCGNDLPNAVGKMVNRTTGNEYPVCRHHYYQFKKSLEYDDATIHPSFPDWDLVAENWADLPEVGQN